MDQLSKWPSSKFRKLNEGQTAIRFLEQYLNLNGIPKTIKFDKAYAFAGWTFRKISKNH